MSKRQARAAKKAAEDARAVRRAGMAAFLAFGVLMAVGTAGALLLMRGRAHQHGAGTVGHDDETVIDLGNDRCPTCGGSTVAGVAVTWHHLSVRLAHPKCDAAFCESPEKLLDASGLDWRAAARAAREINHLSGSARDAALLKAAARWHVVPAASEH